MPLNDRKVIGIILEQVKGVPERCDGYRGELVDVISEILKSEREHRVQATHIQKRISDKVNAVARLVAEKIDSAQGEGGPS